MSLLKFYLSTILVFASYRPGNLLQHHYRPSLSLSV